MGRPYRGYIGFASDQSQYELANSLGGIVSLFERNQTLASQTTITGGTVIPSASTPDGYDYHVFTGSSTLTVIGGPVNCDLMLIAGGGGGGGRLGGGGGGGGYLYLPNVSVATGDHTVTVGAGGAADPVTYPNASQGTAQRGEPTTFGSYKAWGGGGGCADNGGNATHGGSGGGGATNAGNPSKDGLNPSTPSAIITSDFPGETHPYAYTQGYPGGPGAPAGGGGAGGAAPPSNRDGGIGVVGDIPMPTPYGAPGPSPGRWFAGGGGGCGYPSGPGVGGGPGGPYAGGGPGGSPPANDGTNGSENTGGGGGGGGQDSGDSGKGGSGLCVVRVLV